MAATTKSNLLDITHKEFEKLEQLLGGVGSAEAIVKDVEDTSIKDVIGHRAHWIDLFLGWYVDGNAGKEVFFPAKGYKWNELKRYNAEIRTIQGSLSWYEIKDLLLKNHCKLLKLLDECSEEALYGGPMKGANNNWTAGRWAEAAGPSHYRSASKYIRGRLKDLR